MMIDDFLREQQIPLHNWLDSTTRSYRFPQETNDGDCVFFNKAHRTCRIHPVKPETCRAGPITFDVDFSRRCIEWFVKPGSECSVADSLRQEPLAFYQYLKMAKTVLMQLIRELDQQALQALVTIDEPTVLKIGEDPLR
jgi:hypothetical protein